MVNTKKIASKALAENLKRLRKERGWSQNVLAEKSDLSVGAIKMIETEVRWPRSQTIGKIADAFDINISQLTSEQNAAPKYSHIDKSLLVHQQLLIEIQKELNSYSKWLDILERLESADKATVDSVRMVLDLEPISEPPPKAVKRKL